MNEVRLIDANSVCKKIVESIRCAEEWANEAKEQQDTHGLRCATEAKTSLLAMLTRIHDEPTIEAEPDKDWISVTDKMPKLGQRVMAFCRADILTFLRYDGEVWFEMSSRNEYLLGFVTHWQPLPKLPKGE